MLNPQVLSQDTTPEKPLFDILDENYLCFFNFSNLKSRGKLQLSDYNSFNFDFSKNERSFVKINTSNHLKEEDIPRYIKNIIIDLPTIKEEEKNKILNNYDDSFVKFCGITKKQFNDIYLSNLRFNPTLNEFGDIMICIKGIIDLIKVFSESKRLKIKRNRPKKKVKNQNKNLFKIFQTEVEKKGNKNNSEIEEKNSEEKNEKETSEEKNDNATPIIINIKDDEKNEQNLKKQKNNKTLFNIKKKLKNIVIPKTDSEQISKNLSNSSIESKKDLNSSYNNINTFNDNSFNINIYSGKKTNSSGIIRHFPMFSCKNNLSNQSLKSNVQNSNNIFNFSSNAIQNFCGNQDKSKNEIPSKHLLTPNITSNNLNSSLNNNLNLNTPKSRPILSPLNLSPGTNNNILSPNLNHFPNILSPILQNTSPFNINYMFNDCFNFNNTNTTSFIFGNNDYNVKKNVENDDNNSDKNEESEKQGNNNNI